MSLNTAELLKPLFLTGWHWAGPLRLPWYIKGHIFGYKLHWWGVSVQWCSSELWQGIARHRYYIHSTVASWPLLVFSASETTVKTTTSRDRTKSCSSCLNQKKHSITTWRKKLNTSWGCYHGMLVWPPQIISKYLKIKKISKNSHLHWPSIPEANILCENPMEMRQFHPPMSATNDKSTQS